MFNNLDDPRKQALLAAAFGLLGGKGGKGFRGFAQDAAGAGLLSLNTFNQATQMKDRRSDEEQQRKMRDMQMGQMQRGMEDQDFARQLAPNFFAPGVQPSTPNDDQGNPMPSSAPKQDFMGYGQALAARNPQMGAQFMAMAPKPKEPKWAIAPNGQPVDMNALDPKQNYAPPRDWQNPEYRQFREGVARAGAPNVSVGGPVMEKEEHKAKAQMNMKGFEELQNFRRAASKENSLIDAMLRNPVDTNKAAPITTTAKAWLSGLGVTGDRFDKSVSDAQAFNAAAMEMVLNRQAIQKGPQTDSDAKRLEQTVASLGNTPAANRAILAFSKAQNNRLIDQAKFYDDWWKKNRTIEGAEDAWYSGAGGKSLFETPELKGYQGSTVIRYDSNGQRIP